MAEANAPLGTDAQFHQFVATVEEYAVFMLTADGAIATWNAGVGRILGYDAAGFVGQPSALIFTPEDRARDLPALEIATASATGKAENERWHVREDGSRFWGLGVLTALRDPAGNLVGFAKVLRDRTDLKELQETLRQKSEALAAADERKNVFLATLGHELRNHLASIVNAAQVLKLIGSGQPALAAPLAIVDRQTGQLRRLVDDLLDLTRISTGKVQLRKGRVDLTGVVQQAVEASRPALDAAGHQLSVLVPPDPVWLDADAARLQQVLVNLLTNAAKYTPAGGQVWLSATVEGADAVVRVRDTGVGLSAEMLPCIFDLFTQVEAARPRSQGGLGIGLALVRNLVELHGGTVQVRSDGVGKGSEFAVRLPTAAG